MAADGSHPSLRVSRRGENPGGRQPGWVDGRRPVDGQGQRCVAHRAWTNPADSQPPMVCGKKTTFSKCKLVLGDGDFLSLVYFMSTNCENVGPMQREP